MAGVEDRGLNDTGFKRGEQFRLPAGLNKYDVAFTQSAALEQIARDEMRRRADARQTHLRAFELST
jgi:hypothetical protein